MSALILDLRDNPGGLVSAGLEVSKQLLRPGDVFLVARSRDGTEEVVAVADSALEPALADLPVVRRVLATCECTCK